MIVVMLWFENYGVYVRTKYHIILLIIQLVIWKNCLSAVSVFATSLLRFLTLGLPIVSHFDLFVYCILVQYRARRLTGVPSLLFVFAFVRCCPACPCLYVNHICAHLDLGTYCLLSHTIPPNTWPEYYFTFTAFTFLCVYMFYNNVYIHFIIIILLLIIIMEIKNKKIEFLFDAMIYIII